MKTSEKIIKYIKEKGQASGKELTDYLELSDRAVRKQLTSLLEKKILKKIGRSPKVFYLLADEIKKSELKIKIDKHIEKIVNDNYLLITPIGEKKEGLDGFIYFCEKNKLAVAKTAKEYVKTLTKYEKYQKNDLIEGIQKMKNTFTNVHLDLLFYLSFYSIERFGKTKLGQLLLYAKQSQNKKIMKELIREIKPQIEKVIKKYKIDGIGFVQPTVKRELQLMKVLESELKADIRIVKITKIKTPIAVPQKTLNKLEDRIENARNTFVVEDNSIYNNILLVDDAVGSGATMNEIASKIKSKKICKGRIIGLAITGSFKGFDVISEV